MALGLERVLSEVGAGQWKILQKTNFLHCNGRVLQPHVSPVGQCMHALLDQMAVTLQLPDPNEEILPGVRWGRFDQLFTPAFWLCRAWYEQAYRRDSFRIGDNLTEEIVACLLGGHGLPAEVGLAAFRRLKDHSLLFPDRDVEKRIRDALMEPMRVGERYVQYRYPSQRARFIALALKRMSEETPPVHSDLALRSWLTSFDGIGLKTASWITRNYLGSDNIAILDIHIFRAGVLANIFELELSIAADYNALESRLIEFALALKIRLSMLDALMWTHMRLFGRFAIQMFNSHRYCAARGGG